MRLLIGSLFAFTVATLVGLGLTWFALAQGAAFGAVPIGAWTAWPKTGTVDIDPYAQAVIARTGELPVAVGDGVAFYARADDQGRAFDGRCDIDVKGTTPTARFWTLTLYDAEGRLVANSLERSGFTSHEIIRNTDGSFVIQIGPRARFGNWLPSGGIDRFILILRLYDTPVGVATGRGRQAPMPSITVKDCT